MIKVYGTTRFSAGVRAVVEERDDWEYVNGELVTADKSIQIPAVPSSVESADDIDSTRFHCFIEINGKFFKPLTRYYSVFGGDHMCEHSFT